MSFCLKKRVISPKNYVTIRNISQDFTSSSTDSTPRPISAQDLKKLSSDENIALLDVREQVEFEAFAIDGAINLPLTELLEAGRNSVLKALIERKIPANAQKSLFTALDTLERLGGSRNCPFGRAFCVYVGGRNFCLAYGLKHPYFA